MKLLEGSSLRVPAIVSLAIAAAVTGAVLTIRSEVAILRALAAMPSARLANPLAGPAIYTGHLRAGAPRTTPAGTPAAAFWWWVVQVKKDQGCNEAPPTVCSEFASNDLVLRGDGVEYRFQHFDDLHGISLLADGRGEWGERRVIDLGRSPLKKQSAIPPALARCAGNRHEYQERTIEEDTLVEVLACHGGGTLRPCEGPIEAVLAVPRMSVHVRRRAGHALGPLRVVVIASAIALVVMGVVAARMRARRHASEPRPAEPRP